MFDLPIPIIGLLIAVFVLVYLVLKTRVHAFIAMLIASAIAGLVGGMSVNETLGAISKGFGGTLGGIGIVIGLGVMMGSVLEVSGAAEKMAYSFIKLLGKKKKSGLWQLLVISSVFQFSLTQLSLFFIQWRRHWQKTENVLF